MARGTVRPARASAGASLPTWVRIGLNGIRSHMSWAARGRTAMSPEQRLDDERAARGASRVHGGLRWVPRVRDRMDASPGITAPCEPGLWHWRWATDRVDGRCLRAQVEPEPGDPGHRLLPVDRVTTRPYLREIGRQSAPAGVRVGGGRCQRLLTEREFAIGALRERRIRRRPRDRPGARHTSVPGNSPAHVAGRGPNRPIARVGWSRRVGPTLRRDTALGAPRRCGPPTRPRVRMEAARRTGEEAVSRPCLLYTSDAADE